MVVREANINDINDILNIEVTLYKDPWSKKAYAEDILSNKYSHIFLLEEDNTLLGYIGFWLVDDYATVTKVSVRKEYQRKGYGSILVNKMIDYINNQNGSSIDLEVRESNVPAINLYIRSGFINVGLRKKYYSDGENAILMIKKLKEGENYEKLHISN